MCPLETMGQGETPSSRPVAGVSLRQAQMKGAAATGCPLNLKVKLTLARQGL